LPPYRAIGGALFTTCRASKVWGWFALSTSWACLKMHACPAQMLLACMRVCLLACSWWTPRACLLPAQWGCAALRWPSTVLQRTAGS
jgi:hypothetical protein